MSTSLMCVYFKKNMLFPMLYFGFLEGTGRWGSKRERRPGRLNRALPPAALCHNLPPTKTRRFA